MIDKKRQDAFEREKVTNENKPPRMQASPNLCVLAPQVAPIAKPKAAPATGITEALNAIGAFNHNGSNINK